MRLRAGQRLRRMVEFSAVREQGRRMDCGAFLLAWRVRSADEPAGPPRVGVVASRAAIGNAVHRNRAKRRLREVYRRNQDLVPASLDLIPHRPLRAAAPRLRRSHRALRPSLRKTEGACLIQTQSWRGASRQSNPAGSPRPVLPGSRRQWPACPPAPWAG
ncbi:MAG: ribonuclease P protein component [Lacunisphaera sp.]